MKINQFIEELKRRNVFKVAVAYGIAGWLIIQIVATVFPAFNFPEWTTQFVIILVAIGLPLSLIFAWAFELTPEGIKKSVEVDITESVTQNTGKKLNRIIISVLSVAVFFLLTERIFFAESTILDRNSAQFETASIAVLPFADLSPEGDQEYFSDGLSEELLNVLAKEQDMKVAGRTSSFKFKGQNENLTLIGSELGVNHILEGSVRKAGNTIRITAQLIKVDDGFHMWSETYDREYTAENIFRIQDEISQMVLNELKVRLLPENEELTKLETIPTEDVEAFEAYLKGNELLVNRIPEEIEQAIEEYERALKFDPNFGQAYARLSMAHNLLYAYGNIDKEEVIELIRENADQAIFIDPSIAQAYAGLSRFYALNDDYENQLKAIQKAHELNPGDPEIINWYAVTIQFEEREKGDSLLFLAHDIDPLSPVITRNASNAYYRKRDFDKAIELLDKNIELYPDFIASYTRKISLLRSEPFGKLDEAFIQAYQGYEQNQENLDFINILINSSFDFELDSLSSFLFNEIIRLFPNNPSAENARMNLKFNEFDSLLDDKEFEQARTYAIENLLEEIGEDSVEFKEYLDNAELDALFTDFYENWEFQKAYDILPELHPEYFTDTLTTHPQWNMGTLRIKYLFEQVGRNDLAENLNKLEYEFGDWVEFKHDKDITKEAAGEVRVLAEESLYNNDIRRYIEIVEEMHFKRKIKNFPWFYEFSEPHEINLLENPELKELIDRIAVDQQRMKDNVVAFLKEEGVWQESWETTDED